MWKSVGETFSLKKKQNVCLSPSYTFEWYDPSNIINLSEIYVSSFLVCAPSACNASTVLHIHEFDLILNAFFSQKQKQNKSLEL